MNSTTTPLLVMTLVATAAGACRTSPRVAAVTNFYDCKSRAAVRGLVVSRLERGDEEPYRGATVAMVRRGTSVAAVVTVTDADGRFNACVLPAEYSVTVTTPDHAAIYRSPVIFSETGEPSELRIVLRAGDVLLRGTATGAAEMPAQTYVRLIRISDQIGDVFFAPLQTSGRFAARIPAGFSYVADVVGGLTAMPVNIEVNSDEEVRLATFHNHLVEAPPSRIAIDAFKKEALPLGPEVSDAQELNRLALEAIVGQAKVVGLGENSHGVGDFAKVRNRFLEVAVTHLGFNVFAIEANFTEAMAINRYVSRVKATLQNCWPDCTSG